MTQKNICSLYQELACLSDERRLQGKRHSIELIVMISILSIMNGYAKFRAIGDFAKRYSSELIELFKPQKNRLPSYSTIRRAIKDIDFDELNNIFEKWTKNNILIAGREWISIDGKEIRGSTIDKEQKFINIISAFCVNIKQVYMMKKVDDKSNEIPKVQELIASFPKNDIVYRMDAMHCQKQTIDIILKKDSHYILQVKSNQKKLLKKVKFNAEYFPA
jgi:hypothetical protein